MADKKYIGIFELADLFDITPEAIRKYEAKGIVQPIRDSANRYRKYSSWEVAKLVTSRSLSIEGFSLNQVSDILQTRELDAHVNMLEALQERIAKEIIYKKRIIALLEQQKNDYLSRKGRDGRLQIEHMPALCCCRLTQNDRLVEKEGEARDNLKAWIRALPFVRMCFMINDAYQMCTCLCLEEESRVRLGLEHLVPDFVIPEKICVICDLVFERSAARYSVFDVLKQAMDKVEGLGFEVEDTRIFHLYAYTQKDGSYRSYVKGFFPIIT